MATYNPGMTATMFHTDSFVSSQAVDDIMNSVYDIVMYFALVTIIWVISTFIIAECTRRKYLNLKWHLLQTPIYFSAVIVVITAISVMALTGLSIQTSAYGTAIQGAKDLRTLIRGIVTDTSTTINDIEICRPTAYAAVKDELTDLLDLITNTKETVESYVDDAIAAVHTAQMSGSFLIIMMLFILSASCLLYVSAHMPKHFAWYQVFGLHIFASAFSLLSAVLLVLLVFQANTCMEPSMSAANLWVIDDETLSYYINCSINPGFENPIKNIITAVDDLCTGLADTTNPDLCRHKIFLKCKTILDTLECPQLTKGLVSFIHAICVESIDAVALTFIASILMFVLILWTIFTLNINTQKPP